MNLKLIKYLALICLISVQAGESGSINQELKTKNNYTYNDVELEINTYLDQCVDMSKINTTTINLKCIETEKIDDCCYNEFKKINYNLVSYNKSLECYKFKNSSLYIGYECYYTDKDTAQKIVALVFFGLVLGGFIALIIYLVIKQIYRICFYRRMYDSIDNYY